MNGQWGGGRETSGELSRGEMVMERMGRLPWKGQETICYSPSAGWAGELENGTPGEKGPQDDSKRVAQSNREKKVVICCDRADCRGTGFVMSAGRWLLYIQWKCQNVEHAHPGFREVCAREKRLDVVSAERWHVKLCY